MQTPAGRSNMPGRVPRGGRRRVSEWFFFETSYVKIRKNSSNSFAVEPTRSGAKHVDHIGLLRFRIVVDQLDTIVAAIGDRDQVVLFGAGLLRAVQR